MSVKVGDRVVLPEYGGSKVTIDEQDFWIFREVEFLGTLDK
jgi:chaperonin GroES